MDLCNKGCLPMDISGPYLSKTELTQAVKNEDDDDDDEDDADDDENGHLQMAGAPAGNDDAPLDFSIKKSAGDESASETDERSSVTPNGLSPAISQEGPLDLSVPRRRSEKMSDSARHAKVLKLETALSMPTSPWGYNAPKHLSKNVAKSPTNTGTWNGKVSRQERREKSPGSMSKSAHSRSAVYQPLLHKTPNPPVVESGKVLADSRKHESKTDPYRPAGRQNPWQSQWMSRSSEQTKDVFTCVWCKESFRSLADMTVHMKQSPRCGMAGMQTTVPVTSPTVAVNAQPSAPHPSSMSSKCSTSSAGANAAANAIKENVSLPRKLVRGQDVWLGKGAEQTRQILKCMWCGQSFKTLADMTTHMRVTQHYTNIISQEQIISWRTPEDKMAAQSQVNAVLTCKVCDQAFGSLKELSYHMVKNSHYKEHILRSITEGGGRRRQTRERRKKSLPVRKLLELERMELNKQSQPNASDVAVAAATAAAAAAAAATSAVHQPKNEVVDGKISCEECTEKVDAKDFVQHIKNCSQGSRESIKSSSDPEGSKQTGAAAKESNLDTPSSSTSIMTSRSSPVASQEAPKDSKSPAVTQQVLQQDDNLCDNVEGGGGGAGSTSVLNAIEKLIEKSFETKGRRNAVSTGILQRLGIDEEVYPPWHPSSSPSSFGAHFRSTVDMQRKSSSPLSRVHDFKMDLGDYSGSESRSRSSSTSEKHPSFDEHLRIAFGLTAKDIMNRVSTPSSASQSCSPIHFRTESPTDERSSNNNNVFVVKNPGSSTPVSTPSSHVSNPGNACSPSKRQTRTPSNEKEEDKESARDEDRGSEDAEQMDEMKAECEEPPRQLETAGDRSTPKSEGRGTPGSRSSSVEPEAAIQVTRLSPTKGIPKKRKNSSHHDGDHHHHHHHHKSGSSNKRRTTRSPKRKNSDISSDHGGDRDSIVGSPLSTNSDFTSPKHSDSAAGDHPLKELQKLLDKTDAHLSRPSLPATPGSILAFSWACSEATASDSLMKCAFCDTHFISKGAYRHHLSKMHFVKDSNFADLTAAAASSSSSPTSSAWKQQQQQSSSGVKTGPSNGTGSAASANNNNNSSNNNNNPGASNNVNDSTSSPKDPQSSGPLVDESPHSKFQKYTELAKQLSSKYV